MNDFHFFFLQCFLNENEIVLGETWVMHLQPIFQQYFLFSRARLFESQLMPTQNEKLTKNVSISLV